MTTVSFHLDDDLNNKLANIAELSERSKSYIIRKAVEHFVSTYQNDSKGKKNKTPNAQTRKSIDEAREGKNLTKIDNFSDFLKTL